MRLRPYRKTDFTYIENWITDERTHALWCANMLSFPLSSEEFHTKLEQNEKDWGSCGFTFTDEAGKPVGFLTYSINEKENSGFVTFAIVDSKERGKGNGTQMMKLLLQYAYMITNVSSVKLNVFDCNQGARKCYEGVGFETVSVTPEAFSYEDEKWGRCFMVARREQNEAGQY